MSAAHTIKEILDIETPADSIHIEPVDARKTVVNTFGSKITGNIGIFKLTGSLTLLNTLIQTGLGSRRSQGFGCFTVIMEV